MFINALFAIRKMWLSARKNPSGVFIIWIRHSGAAFYEGVPSGTPVSVTLVRVRRPKALMDAGDASDGLVLLCGAL